MAEPDTWDDINEHVVEEWKAETTPFERVYEVVEGTREGQSAAELVRVSRQLRLPSAHA